MPLDKSETAEEVLPLMAGLASANGATVRLLHVERPPQEFIDSRGRVIALPGGRPDQKEAA